MPEAKFDPLVQEITAITTVTDSVLVFIDGLKAQLEAAKDDPEEIQAIANELGAQRQRLAAAVPANTPAEG